MPAPAVASIVNFRGVGPLPTAEGAVVRPGLLYRSGALSRTTAADADAVARLGIRTVYDLRSAWERADAPDRLPDGARYVPLDVIEGMGDAGPGRLRSIIDDPASAHEVLGNGRGTAMWVDQYRDFVRDEGARRAFGSLFVDLAADGSRPALLHCSTGKDRTGWAVAVLLWLLRVPDELVMRDYLTSHRRLRADPHGFLAAWEARGGDGRLLRPIFAARRTYLQAGRLELQRRFGSVERYVTLGLGVPASAQRNLRRAFLEQQPAPAHYRG